MSRSTMGDSSLRSRQSSGSDWQSNRTTSTRVSSKTTTYTSTGSAKSNLNTIILIKLVVVVITGVGGAIMALCINVTHRGYGSPSPEETYEELLKSVPENRKQGPVTNVQLKSETHCLSHSDGKKDENVMRVEECEDSYTENQIFSVEENKLKTTREDEKQEGICASVLEELVSLNPCETSDTNELWAYLKNNLIYHYETGKCLSGKGLKKGDPVKLVTCDPEDPFQQWTSQKVTKKPLVILPVANGKIITPSSPS